MENSNDTIGNRTRDLPSCSAMPQPAAYLSKYLNVVYNNNNNNKNKNNNIFPSISKFSSHGTSTCHSENRGLSSFITVYSLRPFVRTHKTVLHALNRFSNNFMLVISATFC
jgi:hypothetical protein